MQQLVTRLEDSFDAVIIDAPPLLPVTDAAVLAQHVGGVVLVIGAQKLRKPDLEKSLAALQLVDAQVLGVVMNRLPANGPDAYQYGYYESLSNVAQGAKARGRERTDRFSSLDDQRLRDGEVRAASVFPAQKSGRQRQR
jgi:Mrp family chromosome partitioning ATPase